MQAELEAEEEKLLETCVAAWLVSAEANLSSLDSVFDPSTVVVAKAQLASTLGLVDGGLKIKIICFIIV